MFRTGAPVAASRWTAQYAVAAGSDGQRKLLTLTSRLVELAGTSIARLKLIVLKRVRLLELGQEHRGPAPAGAGIVAVGVEVRHVAGREGLVSLVVAVQRQADLLQVVDALRPARRLTRRLNGGQEQTDQHGDDRDHHQQLDQGEPPSAARRLGMRSRHGSRSVSDTRFAGLARDDHTCRWIAPRGAKMTVL